jgi:predicted O-methyltransferase YrrM
VNAPVAYQVEWEFDQLMNVLELPQRILEVGCYEGGTLWHWLRMAKRVVAVDDLTRNADEWQEWADETGCDLHIKRGDSHDRTIIEDVRDLGPYDLVFIDADHTYQACRADVDHYGTMLTEGGVLVLHDILPRPNYGVSQVWAELKSIPGVRYMEIAKNDTEPGNEGPCGIGLLWV